MNIGVIGIHGFSRTHLTQFLARQAAGDCTLKAVVAHEREKDPAYAASLEAQGVRLVPDLDALLAVPGLDLVSVPLGIHLHAPVTLRCLSAGLAVYLEKPVAGSLAEVDALIAAERAASRPVLVGFQDLFQPGLWQLKQRLLAGDFGAVRGITVTIGWPRSHAYFARNGWAGKMRLGDSWVRDSIANNACAHFLNLALFLAGARSAHSATPVAVTAELGRGYAIESFDTASIAMETADGPPVLFNASHLGASGYGPCLRIDTAAGPIICDDLENGAGWRLPDGSVIPVVDRHVIPYIHTLRFLRGEDVPVCRLGHGRVHTQVIEAAHASCPVADLPGIVEADGSRRLPGLDQALVEAHRSGLSLGRTGRVAGLIPGARITIA